MRIARERARHLGAAGWWLAGVLALVVLAALSLVTAYLPPFYGLVLLAVAGATAVLLASPRWTLILLLLVRSSADGLQDAFALFPGQWYSFNFAGLLNIFGVGIALLLLARRLARGQRVLPSAPLQVYAAFLFVAALGLPGSIDFGASLKAWARFAGALGIALLALEAAENARDDSGPRSIPRAITIAALPPLALGAYQAATGGGRFFAGYVGTQFAFRPQGTFDHPATLGAFLVIVAALGLAAYVLGRPLWPRLVLLGLAGACLGLLVLTFARAEWLGGLAMLALIGLLRYRRLLVIGLAAALILVLAVPAIQARLQGEQASESWEWRMDVWGASLSILQRPTLLGSGLDTSPALINQRLPSVLAPPHNDYLRMAIETGIIGLAVFLLLGLSLVRAGAQAFRRFRDADRGAWGLALLSVAVAGLVISVADNYFSYASVQWYLWTLVGLLAAGARPAVEARREVAG